MATTELCFLNLTHLHKLTVTQQSQYLNHPNQNQNRHKSSLIISYNNRAPSSWMWNPSKQVSGGGGEEDSWEVRAFAEDTGGNATWPPRSYTCAFCRREFRSAQALGGHMNVHRRDRARLHGQLIPAAAPPGGPSSPAALGGAHASFLIPAAGGVCLLYQFRNPSGREAAAAASEAAPAGFFPPPPPPLPSTLLSISPAYGPAAVARNFLIDGDSACRIHARVDEEQVELGECRAGKEELDLELRLGHGPTPS